MSLATNQEKIKIMTLQNAVNHFKNLEAKTTKKSEIKIYQKFIQLLYSLGNSALSESEIQSIEKQLDGLDLNSTSTKNKNYFLRTVIAQSVSLTASTPIISWPSFSMLRGTFSASRVVLTSGGSEADLLGVAGAALARVVGVRAQADRAQRRARR